MKVVTSKQMAFIESQAYRNGSSEEDFMEEAGKGVAAATAAFVEHHALPKQAILLCGKGNNAGDAYVAGIDLISRGFRVTAFQIVPIHECSLLCQKNYSRFQEIGGIAREVDQIEELKLPEKGILLDALFGTGFRGTPKEPYASAIRFANRSALPILAIDIPSGLCGETGAATGDVIRAAETIFLGLPKTGFFLQEGWDHVGKLRGVNFGLPQAYIEGSEADFLMLSKEMMHPLLPPIINSRHKYQAGYVVGLAGSPGMPGAALLATSATLRSGAGIVKLLHPRGMEGELAFSPYELIKVPYEVSEFGMILDLMNKASATLIGPGLGRAPQVKKLLQSLLPKLEKPCVIDADALTLIAEDKILLPEHAILTPHIGEMIRLLRRSAPQPHTMDFLKTCQTYAEEHRVTIVLKGGPTFIFHPDETIRVNPHGDPGMATAGSGDVLSGVIAALLSQKLSSHDAASLGVYLHGTAGEIAAEQKSSYSLIASDLIDYLPSAFLNLMRSYVD